MHPIDVDEAAAVQAPACRRARVLDHEADLAVVEEEVADPPRGFTALDELIGGGDLLDDLRTTRRLGRALLRAGVRGQEQKDGDPCGPAQHGGKLRALLAPW